MATATLTEHVVGTAESRFVIHGIDWDGYEALLKLMGDRRSIRLAYDRGSVELMSPLPKHERYGYLFGRMVQDIALELDIDIACMRSTTFRRRDVARGIEADDSYYIANAHLVPDTDKIDLDQVPPPDLAIEIEITNSILDRLEIYSRLGVPELWRFDTEKLIVLILQPDGSYLPSDNSLAFPFLPLEELVRFAKDHVIGKDNAWARRFRGWVRKVLRPIYRNWKG